MRSQKSFLAGSALRVFLQVAKKCTDCPCGGVHDRFTVEDDLVRSCVKPWHVQCYMTRHRGMVQAMTSKADQRVAVTRPENSKQGTAKDLLRGVG